MNVDLVAIGDSVTYGYLMNRSQTWVSIAAKTLGISIRNEGQNGDSTAGMLYRFPPLLTPPPKKVFIMGGVNDFFMGIPYETVEKNLFSMARLAKEKNIPVILGTPHEVNLRRNNFFMDRSYVYKAVNEKIVRLREAILGSDHLVVDFYGAMHERWNRDEADAFYFDEVHLNAQGNAFLAKVAVDSKAFLLE